MSDEATALARLLSESILAVDPERRVGTEAALAREIDRMLRADSRDAREVESLVRWHFEHHARPYALSIWSARALREKYDRLRDQRARSSAAPASGSPAGTIGDRRVAAARASLEAIHRRADG